MRADDSDVPPELIKIVDGEPMVPLRLLRARAGRPLVDELAAVMSIEEPRHERDLRTALEAAGLSPALGTADHRRWINRVHVTLYRHSDPKKENRRFERDGKGGFTLRKLAPAIIVMVLAALWAALWFCYATSPI